MGLNPTFYHLPACIFPPIVPLFAFVIAQRNAFENLFFFSRSNEKKQVKEKYCFLFVCFFLRKVKQLQQHRSAPKPLSGSGGCDKFASSLRYLMGDNAYIFFIPFLNKRR